MKKAKILLTIFLLGYCSSVLYQPKKEELMNPEKLGFKKSEEFFTTSDKTKLNLWFIKPDEQEANKNAVILQFHGNGENMSSHFISLVWLVNHGYELVTYDYRGYGKSEGSPNPKEINSDSVEVINYVISYCKKNNKKLIIYAQSLGGAIAARALSEVKDKSLISIVIFEGTFSDYKEVANSILRKQIIQPFPYLLSLFVSNSYSPKDYFEKISPIPIVVIHETEDPVVPFENGKEVFRLSKDPKQFWSVTGQGHIRWMLMGRSPNAKKFRELLDQLISEGY
ncbi:MAG: alpha/beta hydrolase [Leptospiraceae bacterium]|nr:alpha/beta hydrolase [Leptospiraceae bacterium]